MNKKLKKVKKNSSRIFSDRDQTQIVLNLNSVGCNSKLTCKKCFLLSAKNQGLALSKNSASTTIHNEQSFGPSQQTSSNTRFNMESRSINGFQTTKNELDIAMLQILDPHLRPVPPVPNEPTSQNVYSEHMALAQEYFKVIY